MRVVLDTNVLLSGLISDRGAPPRLLDAWREERFDLVSSEEQLAEVRAVTRRDALRALVTPSEVGRFVNDLRLDAMILDRLPRLDRSSDPADNFLLAMAEAGEAQFLVSGDRRGVLDLKTHGPTRIVRARELLEILKLPPIEPR